MIASASTPAAGPSDSARTNISAHTISGTERSNTISVRTAWRSARPRQRPSAGPIAETDSERVAQNASGTRDHERQRHARGGDGQRLQRGGEQLAAGSRASTDGGRKPRRKLPITCTLAGSNSIGRMELRQVQQRPQQHQRRDGPGQAPARQRIAQRRAASRRQRVHADASGSVARCASADRRLRGRPDVARVQRGEALGRDLGRRQVERDDAVAHAHDARKPAQRQVDGVQRRDERGAGRRAVVDQLAQHRVGGGGVERRHRLVGQQQARRLVQRARHGHALQLAARQLVAAVEHALAQAHARERVTRARDVAGQRATSAARAPRPHWPEPAGQHRGDHAQPRRDRRRLVHEADARAQRLQRAGAQRPRIGAEQRDAAVGRAAARPRPRAAASSCRRPTARSARRARRRRRSRSIADSPRAAVRVDEADAVESQAHRAPCTLT